MAIDRGDDIPVAARHGRVHRVRDAAIHCHHANPHRSDGFARHRQRRDAGRPDIRNQRPPGRKPGARPHLRQRASPRRRQREFERGPGIRVSTGSFGQARIGTQRRTHRQGAGRPHFPGQAGAGPPRGANLRGGCFGLDIGPRQIGPHRQRHRQGLPRGADGREVRRRPPRVGFAAGAADRAQEPRAPVRTARRGLQGPEQHRRRQRPARERAATERTQQPAHARPRPRLRSQGGFRAGAESAEVGSRGRVPQRSGAVTDHFGAAVAICRRGAARSRDADEIRAASSRRGRYRGAGAGSAPPDQR